MEEQYTETVTITQLVRDYQIYPHDWACERARWLTIKLQEYLLDCGEDLDELEITVRMKSGE